MKKKPDGNELTELRNALAHLIANGILDTGQLNYASIAMPAMKLADKMIEYEIFNMHLRSTDIMWVIVDYVINEVNGTEKEKREQVETVQQLIGDAGVKALEDKISDFFRSIPRQYFTYWGLPNCTAFGFTQIDLADSIALVQAKADLGVPIRQQAVPFGLNALLSIPSANMVSKGLMPEGVYLRVATTGYTGVDFDAFATRSALSRVKQTLIMGISEGLFRTGYTGDSADFFSHSAQNGSEEQNDLVLPGEISAFLGSIKFAVGAAGALPLDEKHGPELVRRKFNRAKTVLNKPEDDRDATAIRTACEWCFDSRVSRNETLAFLEACIGLEAILGEHGSDEPITKRLADRCAYLVGNTIQERNEIRDLFIKVYDVRSKIVHGRRPTLSPNDERHLDNARGLLQRVIAREVELIQPPNNKAA